MALYPLKVLTILFKMQTPETYSGFQCQFHIQNLNDLSSGPFPIQTTYFLQNHYSGNPSWVTCPLWPWSLFRVTVFQETTPLPIDQQTICFLSLNICSCFCQCWKTDFFEWAQLKQSKWSCKTPLASFSSYYFSHSCIIHKFYQIYLVPFIY